MTYYPTCLYADAGDRTELASFTTGASLLAGRNSQPVITGLTAADASVLGQCKTFKLLARGSFGSTGTPTYTFEVNLHTSQSVTDVTGTQIMASAAITTASGVTNGTLWELDADIMASVSGMGTNGMTVSVGGSVWSTGFASPFRYPLTPAGSATTTWTIATFDAALTYWLQVTAACSASSSSNAIRLKQIQLLQLN